MAKTTGKRYEQYCPTARTLDVVGERWTLLIVRDLLMGPKRYTDLRGGLPGIATDILTARLRTLEEAGFVRRRELPRPAPATVYELTDRGRGLGLVVLALGQVGLTELGAPRKGEDVRGERIVIGLRVSFRRDRFPDLDETYELTVDGEPYVVEVKHGWVETSLGPAKDPAFRLRIDAGTLADLLTGELSPAQALGSGRAELDGERRELARFVEAFAFPAVAAA
jgi:DNA-binding HxlR family transcriptional regulator/putative sterol carrier protein